MIFYVMGDDGQWLEFDDVSEIIHIKGLNHWYPVDFTQDAVFHQQIGSKWQPVTRKQIPLYRPPYYY